MKERIEGYLEENPRTGVAVYAVAGGSTASIGLVAGILDGNPDLLAYSGSLAAVMTSLGATSGSEKY